MSLNISDTYNFMLYSLKLQFLYAFYHHLIWHYTSINTPHEHKSVSFHSLSTATYDMNTVRVEQLHVYQQWIQGKWGGAGGGGTTGPCAAPICNAYEIFNTAALNMC